MKKIILLLILSIFSCKEEKSKPNNLPEKTEINISSFERQGMELLKNNDFRNWDTNAKPTNWDINEDFEIPEDYVVDRDTLDLLLKGHKDKRIYIKQAVNVEPNSYYILEGDIGTQLRHGSYTGFMVSTEEGKLLGKRIFDIRGEQESKVVFNSNRFDKVNCYIGFINEGIGEISIKSISLKKLDINNSVFKSIVAQDFFNILDLNFDDGENFDVSISKLMENISDIILSSQKNDTLNMKRKDQLLLDLKEPSFLKTFLQEPSDKATKSYASKLVFSGNEIFDYFNIGSRVIEFRTNNKRVHLALMYYNPYLNEWVTIDPLYNSKINANSNLESITKDQVLPANYGGLITNDIDGLLQKYNSSKAIIQKETIMGYPF
ncbi:MAG: hypothetical protein O2906_04975 [Bacteroidetes bacterium]|nr:hypothetical protein [Bacteroidota bacterium]MDA0860309.1 hypothetical protein [Bacteroidota bacterium]MDA1318517.1 hypothetical protein [Bacteroidota bacterium]